MPRRSFHLATFAATARTLSARHPAAVRTVVLGLALLVGGRVWSAQHAAEAARRSWGDLRTVWVVGRSTDRGEVVAVRAEQYPSAVVPVDAVGVVPSGARAARRLSPGTVLTTGDLLGDGAVPVGWVVLSVPADGAPPVVDGDAVSLFAPDRTLCDGVVSSASSGGATDSIAVAVPSACAASAVVAVSDRTVLVARRVVDGPAGD